MQGSGSYTDVWQNGQSLLSVWLELFSNACNGEGVLEICHQKLMPQQKKRKKIFRILLFLFWKGSLFWKEYIFQIYFIQL